MYKKRKVLLIIEGKYVWTYFVEDGEIAEIYVENGKPVEYGQKLFRIK